MKEDLRMHGNEYTVCLSELLVDFASFHLVDTK